DYYCNSYAGSNYIF
nr:immunoglobulin light chain junction region [Macaca mulatta]